MRYYSSMEKDLNDLIQKSVEHGFLQFYDRLETFFRRLTDKTQDVEKRFESMPITMDNIRIFVFVFLGAHCFNCVVFLCEHLIFHRKKIVRAFIAASHQCEKGTLSCWRKILMKLRAMRRAAGNVKLPAKYRALKIQNIGRK